MGSTLRILGKLDSIHQARIRTYERNGHYSFPPPMTSWKIKNRPMAHQYLSKESELYTIRNSTLHLLLQEGLLPLLVIKLSLSVQDNWLVQVDGRACLHGNYLDAQVILLAASFA